MNFRQWQKDKMVYFQIGSKRLLNVDKIDAFPTMRSTDVWTYEYLDEYLDEDDDDFSDSEEIYEDDIVEVLYKPDLFCEPVERYGYVEYSSMDGCWQILFPEYGTSMPLVNITDEFQEIKVLGNVYENPELYNIETGELLIGKVE